MYLFAQYNTLIPKIEQVKMLYEDSSKLSK